MSQNFKHYALLFLTKFCFFMHLFGKILSGNANSVDPDQTTPSGAIWFGSALFAHLLMWSLEFSFISDKLKTDYHKTLCRLPPEDGKLYDWTHISQSTDLVIFHSTMAFSLENLHHQTWYILFTGYGIQHWDINFVLWPWPVFQGSLTWSF